MKKGRMLQKMLLLATEAHGDQYDRGGMPYILHPLKVMHYLKTSDEELQCIALGHDLLEDTSVTSLKLSQEGFSERVITAIQCLTKTKGQTYEDYKQQVLSNVDAMRVKLCDLRHNSDIRRLKGVTQKDIDRMQKYHLFFLEITAKLQELKETV